MTDNITSALCVGAGLSQPAVEVRQGPWLPTSEYLTAMISVAVCHCTLYSYEKYAVGTVVSCHVM
jgi:hypothetical protein